MGRPLQVQGRYYTFNKVGMVKPIAGQKAMINGATGAIGSSAVQFLKF
jgi:NADPH:quinone reductase-like Zn-dependent oxidoreductase